MSKKNSFKGASRHGKHSAVRDSGRRVWRSLTKDSGNATSEVPREPKGAGEKRRKRNKEKNMGRWEKNTKRVKTEGNFRMELVAEPPLGYHLCVKVRVQVRVRG